MQKDDNGSTADDRAKAIFAKMDKNHDERLSLEEFIQGAKRDASIVKILQSN